MELLWKQRVQGQEKNASKRPQQQRSTCYIWSFRVRADLANSNSSSWSWTSSALLLQRSCLDTEAETRNGRSVEEAQEDQEAQEAGSILWVESGSGLKAGNQSRRANLSEE